MKLRQLEREFAEHGFYFVRISQDTHRVYENADGKMVILAPRLLAHPTRLPQFYQPLSRQRISTQLPDA